MREGTPEPSKAGQRSIVGDFSSSSCARMDHSTNEICIGGLALGRWRIANRTFENVRSKVRQKCSKSTPSTIFYLRLDIFTTIIAHFQHENWLSLYTVARSQYNSKGKKEMCD
jgi:hypothetical protein